MRSYMSIAFIFLAIGGLLGQQIQEFCDDHYCYRTDGELKNITSLKDAQDYCTNNDSSSWLLEIYGLDSFQNLLTKGFTNPIICNSVGTVAFGWTSVIDGQLPTGITVYESLGKDFLFLSLAAGQLSFYGADKTFLASFNFLNYICRVPGNCPGGYCYEVWNNAPSWFKSEFYCFTNQTTVDKDYGNLATFDGMTYDDISKLSFVNQLTDDAPYWIGYSKLIYTWQHSNVRSNILNFDSPYPFLTSSRPDDSYFVYFESDNFREESIGNKQFQIICMIDMTASKAQTSIAVTTTSAFTTTMTSSEHMGAFSSDSTATTSAPTTTTLDSTLELTTTPTTTTSDTTATTGHTSAPATPTSVPSATIVNSASSTTATHWNSLETNPTTAGLKASNESKVDISESTIILSLLLPILLWLVFSISFICCILPYCVNRNTRREATIP